MKSTMEHYEKHFFVPNIFLGEYSERCIEFEISGTRMDEVCP